MVTVRMDAGFPAEDLLKGLEKQRIRYVARIRTNTALDRLAQPFLDKHATPSANRDGLWCYELRYKAESWANYRRVVLVLQERPGELFTHHFFLLTNINKFRMSAAELLGLYRARGNAEAAMGEWQSVLAPALSSSPRPKKDYAGKPVPPRALPATDECGDVRDPEEQALEPLRRSYQVNETILTLNALAYNLVNALRKQAEAGTGQGWSIRRTREQLLKVSAQVLLHARQVTVTIPESIAGLWEKLWNRLSTIILTPAPFATS